MNITKTESEAIATIINSIMVADMTEVALRGEGKAERARHWRRDGYKNTIELAETYGIELPTLEFAREYLAQI